jgi:hypothetical protein
MVNVTNSTNALENLKEGVAYNLNLSNILMNGLIAALIIVVGAILGKLVSKGLRSLCLKLDLKKQIKGGILDLIIILIKWSIYLVFLHIALTQLGIPIITQIFGNVLITIPAFIASLIIIFLGFAISTYVRSVIKELDIAGKDSLSKISFYFVLYIFGIYALKVALIPLGSLLSDYVIVALSFSLPIALAILLGQDIKTDNH